MDRVKIRAADGRIKYIITSNNDILEACWYCQDAAAITDVGTESEPKLICTGCLSKSMHLKDTSAKEVENG